ncbi:MAG TPA: hypothetical protein VJH94_00345 [Candidatus Paceibacterota bacterium]
MNEILRRFNIYLFVFLLLWVLTVYSTILTAAGCIVVIGVAGWQYWRGKLDFLNLCLYVAVFAVLGAPGFFLFWFA